MDPDTLVQLLYTRISAPLPERIYNRYLQKLPSALQEKNRRYLRWQDKHAHLLGKMLLIETLAGYGYHSDCLAELTYNKFDRPSLCEGIDFNISHSEEFVLCAAGKGIKLGVDIEKIRPVHLSDFDKMMTAAQWKVIHDAPHPEKAFFTFWTIKESMIKADGRGLSIPLEEIHVQGETVSYDGHCWYLHDLKIDDEYCAFLAADSVDLTIQMVYKDYADLLV